MMSHVIRFVEDLLLVGTLHRESLARTCLTIRKDADIVAIETRLNEWLDLLKDVSLTAVRGENPIDDAAVSVIALMVD